MTTTNTTPEPGQHVYVEFIASEDEAGKLTPILASGKPSTVIRLPAARYRWHPADVPPQPESPANPRRLYWALRNLLDAIKSTPTNDPLYWTGTLPRALDGALKAVAAEDEAYARGPAADVPPQPPVLDNDALRAIIRRGINDPGAVLPRNRWGSSFTGWEYEAIGAWGARAVLHLLVAEGLLPKAPEAATGTPLADVPGPDDSTPTPAGEAVDVAAIEAEAAEADRIAYRGRPFLGKADVRATTHGEAGEAQTGVQGADLKGFHEPAICAHCGRRCADYAGGWSYAEGVILCHPNEPDRPDCYTAVTLHRHQLRDCPKCCTPKPAAQGAGRDWRGEIMSVLGEQTGDDPLYWREEADAIVAALGLHDLEQAAAEQSVIARETVRRLRAEIEYRKATEAQLTAERDAARRALEQLRGDVAMLRLELPAMAGKLALWGLVDAIDDRLAALAAGAPATQDGADHGE